MISFKEFLLTEKNWIRAYKIHSRIEKKRGNPYWKARHAIVGSAIASTAAAIHSKDVSSISAVLGANMSLAATLGANHFHDIHNIRKKLNTINEVRLVQNEDGNHDIYDRGTKIGHVKFVKHEGVQYANPTINPEFHGKGYQHKVGTILKRVLAKRNKNARS